MRFTSRVVHGHDIRKCQQCTLKSKTTENNKDLDNTNSHKKKGETMCSRTVTIVCPINGTHYEFSKQAN